MGSAAGFSSIDVTAAGLRERCTITEVRGTHGDSRYGEQGLIKTAGRWFHLLVDGFDFSTTEVRFKQVNRREGLRELVDTDFKKSYLLVAGESYLGINSFFFFKKTYFIFSYVMKISLVQTQF